MTSQLIEISQKHSVRYTLDGYQGDDINFYEVKYGRY